MATKRSSYTDHHWKVLKDIIKYGDGGRFREPIRDRNSKKCGKRRQIWDDILILFNQACGTDVSKSSLQDFHKNRMRKIRQRNVSKRVKVFICEPVP